MGMFTRYAGMMPQIAPMVAQVAPQASAMPAAGGMDALGMFGLANSLMQQSQPQQQQTPMLQQLDPYRFMRGR